VRIPDSEVSENLLIDFSVLLVEDERWKEPEGVSMFS
jgi:hypothetical protein